jgi:flavin reductase (DIM6/NTAB) family NADH-FMN oxidoreductase RutF
MTVQKTSEGALAEMFRDSMRLVASSVSLVTARDYAGNWHGMAVTSAGSLSLDPPSMMVAINRTSSIHPVILASGYFTLNLMDESHADMLEPFSRSDMRDRRFVDEAWVPAGLSGPVLMGALCSHICKVAEAHDFGTHTVFFGTIDDVILDQSASEGPILWLNGKRRSIAAMQPV